MAPPPALPINTCSEQGEGEGDNNTPHSPPPSHRLSKYGTGAYNPETIFTRCLKSEAFAKSTIFVEGKTKFPVH